MVRAMIAKMLFSWGIVSSLCCAVLVGRVAAAPATLAGHQATYGVTLASATSGSGLVAAEGAVHYRFADACEGWTVENRTLLRFTGDEGAVSESLWSYTSWESKDGLSFRARVREITDGEVTEDFSGEASLERRGSPGKARFRKSIDRQLDLPAGTQFPTQHLRGLLASARGGQHYVPATVFDGADADNPYRVGTVIGVAADGVSAKLAQRAGLVDMPVWSVQMAFFAANQPAAVPIFEVGANYREDGIADTILQDIGGLVLRMTLESVELLPAPDC